MSKDQDKTPRIALTGSVSAELRESVEQHRWANRQSVSDVVSEALTEWATKRGYKVGPDPVPEPAESAPEGEQEASASAAKARR